MAQRQQSANQRHMELKAGEVGYLQQLLVTAPTLRNALYRVTTIRLNTKHDHVYKLWARVLKLSFETVALFSRRHLEQPERGELQ